MINTSVTVQAVLPTFSGIPKPFSKLPCVLIGEVRAISVRS